MKNTKFSLYGLALLAIVIGLFNSCLTENPDPTITIAQASVVNNAQVDKDEMLIFKGVATKGADGKNVSSLLIKVSRGGASATTVKSHTDINAANFNFNDTLYAGNDAGQEIYTILATATDGKLDSETISITVLQGDTGDKPKYVSDMVFSSEYNGSTYSSTGHEFISAANELDTLALTYTAASEASIAPTIDFTYFYKPQTTTPPSHNFVSPTRRTTENGYGVWSVTDFTKSNLFKRTSLTEAQFTALRDSDEVALQSRFDNGFNDTFVDAGSPLESENTYRFGGTRFTQGAVLAFYNGDKYGLVLVKELNATGCKVSILIQD